MRMIPLDAAIDQLLEDTKISSRVVDALRHPVFQWLKKLEEREDVLRAMLQALKAGTGNPHLMGMIFDLNGGKGVVSKKEDLGVTATMREHLLEWAAENGLVKADDRPVKRVVHALRAGRAVCGAMKGLPREWPMEHWWVSDQDVKQVNCPGCRKELGR